MQLSHHNKTFEKKPFPIILVCDNISKAPNIGSLFRIADAFGVEKLLFCGQNIPLGRRITKTSRATEKVVAYEIHEDIISLVNKLKLEGHFIVSLEITSNSISINKYNFPNQPIALIIGDENHGVSHTILEMSDIIIHIDMFGHNSSMNVAQATSIALYEITKQMNN